MGRLSEVTLKMKSDFRHKSGVQKFGNFQFPKFEVKLLYNADSVEQNESHISEYYGLGLSNAKIAISLATLVHPLELGKVGY